MIANPVLRDHRSPIHNIGIIPEREDSGMGELLGQQCLRPRRGSIFRCPSSFQTAGKAMDEDDTENHQLAILMLSCLTS